MSFEVLIIIIAVFAFSAVALVFNGEREMFGNWARFFRPLFPTWRFFEDVTEIPIMFYRIALPGGEFGEWRPAIKVLERRWYSVFINPEGNLNLAAHSLLQQLEIELGELQPEQAESFEGSVAYELARNLAQYLANKDTQRLNSSSSPDRLQFKIGRVLQGSSTEDFEQFLQSKVYQL